MTVDAPPPEPPRPTLEQLVGPMSPLTPDQARRALALVLARLLMPNATPATLRRTAAWVTTGSSTYVGGRG